VQTALVVVHLLAAAVWVGGTVALVFVGVPVVRMLEGETRARAMRALGRRWRPIGWSAMGVAIATGLALAALELDDAESAFDEVLQAKVVAVVLLVAASAVHDFVLGPRLAAQIRAGEPPTLRPRLIAVGWVAFALTVTVPVLGVVLGSLA
jgi:putative copper export protein